MSSTISKIGFWSSLMAFLGASTYTIAQILSPPLLPILSFPTNEILIVAPSLLLALAFTVAVSCIHASSPADKKIWSQIALSFAIMYTVIVGSVYILQLATVIPSVLRGEVEKAALLSIVKSQPVQAVDGFGYGLMGLSALFAFPVFTKKGVEKWARLFLMSHGLIAPFAVLPLWFPPIIVVSMLWFVTAPLSLLFLALYFKKSNRQIV